VLLSWKRVLVSLCSICMVPWYMACLNSMGRMSRLGRLGRTGGLERLRGSCFMPCLATCPRLQDGVHAGHLAAVGDIRQGAPSDPQTWDVACAGPTSSVLGCQGERGCAVRRL
jgi:hypothetical protein